MSTSKAKAAGGVERPLSPHLFIYAPSWTMVMSVVHRGTGAALYFGTLLLAAWLIAAASGQAAYDKVAWLFGTWIGLLVLFGYTWALVCHLIGGIRFLIWDMILGFGPERRLLALGTWVLSGVFTILIWIVAYMVK
ncbi:MAG: succinate dehydrogenase, cytochrome b556 subunit [Siculibacillus sp.]|nr:succinate dehydrogenase, cytochrome b556 subunit [Siculibacillus sp.]